MSSGLPIWWLSHPFEKYDRQNWFIFPNFRGENNKYLKPPPRFLNYTYHVYIYRPRSSNTKFCVFLSPTFVVQKVTPPKRNPRFFQLIFRAAQAFPPRGTKVQPGQVCRGCKRKHVASCGKSSFFSQIRQKNGENQLPPPPF